MPTFRAISLANQYNGLLVCSEPEVKFLLGSEAELETYLSEKISLSETIEQVVTKPIETIKSNINIQENEESLLIDKYLSVINTKQNILKLSNEERAEIKRVFNSEFRFFNCLQTKKSN